MQWEYRAFIIVSLYSLHLQCTKRWFGSLSILKDEETEVQWIWFRKVEPFDPSFPLFSCSLLLTFQPLLDFFFFLWFSKSPAVPLKNHPHNPFWFMLEIWLSHCVMILLNWLSYFYPLLWSFLYLSSSVWHHLWPRKIDISWFVFSSYFFLSSARRFCQFWQSLRSRSCKECFECK